MTLTPLDVLRKIRPPSATKDFYVAEKFLQSSETKRVELTVDGRSSDERAVRPFEIVRTWNARLASVAHDKRKLYGCAEFAEALNALRPDIEMIHVAFEQAETVGRF